MPHFALAFSDPCVRSGSYTISTNRVSCDLAIHHGSNLYRPQLELRPDHVCAAPNPFFRTLSKSPHKLTPGNTVYVGLGITGQPYSQPTRWIKSGTSILSFILGSFIFSRLMNALSASPMRRSTLFLSSALQAILTLASAALSQYNIVPPDAGEQLHRSLIVLVPLMLLALQSGGQCVLSRVLGFGEIPTVVITSAYCDLVMDPKLVSGLAANSKRNRRFASMAMLIFGAWIGGVLTKDLQIASALWAVGGVKVIMTLVWLVWPKKTDDHSDD